AVPENVGPETRRGNRGEVQRHPGIGAHHCSALKPGGCDADDDDGTAVERHRTADGLGRAAESALPQFVADDGDGRAPGLVVTVVEKPSARRGRSERPEVVAADWRTVDPLSLLAVAETDRLRLDPVGVDVRK